MTKAEIISELHNRGEMWANASYKKDYLENYLENYKKACKMPIEELYKSIMRK